MIAHTDDASMSTHTESYAFQHANSNYIRYQHWGTGINHIKVCIVLFLGMSSVNILMSLTVLMTVMLTESVSV